ncbi:MAG TPA: GNAT family N-acetyltransferase [Ardenticatenaceae bacterium]|nr:GNAT family N-acetyltransferase [Ardenticatenaceae bacterium]
MTYRPITEADIIATAELQSRAFRTPAERYITAYREGGRFDWNSARLLESEDGQPVAALVVFERMVSLHGGEMAAGLIASVAVPPEHRRRGYARALMGGVLDEMYQARLPLSMLFPFSTAFYRSLGYGLVNLNWYLDIPPSAFPAYSERLAVRRATPDDEGAIRACHERARCQPQNNGWPARTEWEWQNRVWKPEQDVVVYSNNGTIEGYLIYTLTWNRETSTIPAKVIEWVATSEAAWRGLAGFLGALGEQATVVTYNAAQGNPLLLALREPYSAGRTAAEFVFYQAARLVSGFMLRVVHLTSALRARRYPPTLVADVVLRVDDPQLPGNGEPLHVHIENGAASVAPAVGGFHRGQPATVETDIASFSQLFAGFMSGEQARTLGRLDASPTTCALLTEAFSTSPFYLHQADWF